MTSAASRRRLSDPNHRDKVGTAGVPGPWMGPQLQGVFPMVSAPSAPLRTPPRSCAARRCPLLAPPSAAGGKDEVDSMARLSSVPRSLHVAFFFFSSINLALAPYSPFTKNGLKPPKSILPLR